MRIELEVERVTVFGVELNKVSDPTNTRTSRWTIGSREGAIRVNIQDAEVLYQVVSFSLLIYPLMGKQKFYYRGKDSFREYQESDVLHGRFLVSV